MSDSERGNEDSYEFRFSCPQCTQTWSGDDLTRIVQRVAQHTNEKHHSQFTGPHSRYPEIDVEERLLHHLHENEYGVERVPVHITSFDVFERLGLIDGFAVAPDSGVVCSECFRYLDDDSSEVAVHPNFDGEFGECVECSDVEVADHESDEETAVERLSRRRENNRSLFEWAENNNSVTDSA